MRRAVLGIAALCLGLPLVGCGSSGPPKPEADAAQASMDPPEPIAVVGIGCRVAGDVGTPTEF